MNFSNKYIFLGTWVLLVAILSGINNYYFYSHVERSSERDAKQIKEIISTIIHITTTEQDRNSDIINIAQAFATQAHYNRSFKIFDEHNEMIWKYIPKNVPKDTVVGSDIKLIIGNNVHDSKVLYTTYFNIPAFMMSVIKSMTFSVSDIFSITYKEGLKSALESFDKSYWYRSRPTIGFAIFSFLILWIYRKREIQLIENQLKKEESLIISFKKEIDDLSSTVKEDQLLSKFYQYDHILNPPINTSTFKNLVEMDTEGIGNKFRKVLEKILFKIVETKLSKKPRDLKDAIHLLYSEEIISSKVQIYATLIRLYGNMDSHYNENTEITKEEIRVLAYRLVSIIDEVLENKLFDSDDLDTV